MALTGRTQLIAHVGDPTASFRSPTIYNPWFDARGIDARVVPMGVRAPDAAVALPAIVRMSNVVGALVTMPYKVVALGLVDEASDTAHLAGSVNAIRQLPDGRLFGDQFDGVGFVAAILRDDPFALEGRSALVVGAGGVGSAIAASLAGTGLLRLVVHDVRAAAASRLVARLASHSRHVEVSTGPADPAGHDLVINATALGMRPGGPLPLDATRLDSATLVADVVLSPLDTPLLQAARARGCRTQDGEAMLFEQIPEYLRFFGFGDATSDELRALAIPG